LFSCTITRTGVNTLPPMDVEVAFVLALAAFVVLTIHIYEYIPVHMNQFKQKMICFSWMDFQSPSKHNNHISLILGWEEEDVFTRHITLHHNPIASHHILSHHINSPRIVMGLCEPLVVVCRIHALSLLYKIMFVTVN
jgi:hypothetical protein